MYNKNFVGKILIRISQGLIVFYRNIFSGFLSSGQIFIPSVCKFQPTCSAYAHESLGKYGFLKGSWMSLKRVLKCNPFYDCDF